MKPRPQNLEQRRCGFDPLRDQRCLEVCRQPRTESGVLFGSADDVVKAKPGEWKLLCGPHPGFGCWREGPQQLRNALFLVSRHRPLDGVRTRRLPSLQNLPQLGQAARDPACDRAGRQVERLADRAVALIPAEEAVEDLATWLTHGFEALTDVHSLVEPRERLIQGALLLELLLRLLTA